MSMKRSQPIRLSKAWSLLEIDRVVRAGAYSWGREKRSAPLTRRLDRASSMLSCHALLFACQLGDSDPPLDPRASLNEKVPNKELCF